MRETARVLWVVCVAMAWGVGEAGAQGARAVVDRAIRAHGGARRLERAAVATRTGSGTQRQGIMEVKFTTKMVMDLPDRVRLELKLDGGFEILTVINDDKGWIQAGTTQPLPEARLKELREEAYVWWVSTLVPLTKDGFTLKALPDATVEGKPAAVVLASRKGKPDVKFSFDKGSGLLVKMERKASEAGLEVDKAYLLSRHRTFGGLEVPTKEVTTLNGRKWSEVTFESYTFPGTVDKELFARP